jgi:nicotinate-nucleotide--dimethylbenzimidazole phosphoribosyltransferase
MLGRLRDSIAPPHPGLGAAAQRHLDALTKPPGSLGRLEELARRLVEIGDGAPSRAERPVIFTFAADHGVAAEGVSAYPRSVTAQMVENFLRGGAGVNVLGALAGARVVVADFGVASHVISPGEAQPQASRPSEATPELRSCRIGDGTANIARGPAMTREQALQAVESGAVLAEEAIAGGADLLGTGEMGIANTTAASAITTVVTGEPIERVTGRGTGIDDATWRRKVDVIARAVSVNRPDRGDGLGVLAAVGGFEIGGLAGVMLAGAAHRVPVAIDGFIATAAALVAVAIAPHARHYLLASHRSAEPGHAAALAWLGLTPYLDLGLRLGEGTGAALFIPLVRAAVRIYGEMATFKSAGVDGPVAPAAGDGNA